MFSNLLKLFYSFLEKGLKIGIISYYYPFKKPSTSGVGIHVYNLVSNLAKKGCEVHVFTYGKEDEINRTYFGSGKIIVHFLKSDFDLDLEDPVVEKRVRYAIFENRVLNEFLLENSRRKFDIIHTHGWLTSCAFMLKYLTKIPWVHTVHALEHNRLASMTPEEKEMFKITSWIEKTLINADKLIAVSESAKSEILKLFKKSENKIEVIYNGVDLKLFRPLGEKEKMILCVTRFSMEKGVELLPEIIKNVLNVNREFKFVLVAQKTSLPGLKDVQNKLIALSNKFKDRFIWNSDPLMPQNLAKLYQKSEIYVQPSFYETFGLCILEAMACENAVIATNVGGIPEVVGDSGILVEPDSRKISIELIKLLKSRSKIEEYKKKAFERAKNFDWRTIANKTIVLYKKVIENTKSS
jgi:glycosyltransferase involved in cell wall biosynthesis